jgi:hypothetical protein
VTKDKVAEDLSKQVSAFANTYGGQILLGVRETRKPPRKAEAIVGLRPDSPPIETLQRLVDGNVRPRVEGLRFHSVQLSGANEGSVVYVIVVPKGSTAHQARDKLYYGRQEYESVPLDDQMIRYKMVRDRIAEARIELRSVSAKLAQKEYEARQTELQQLERTVDEVPIDERIGASLHVARRREELEAPPDLHDQYTFSLAIRNTGSRTIVDCTLRVAFDAPFEVGLTQGPPGDSVDGWILRFAEQNQTVLSERFGRTVERAQLAKLFPEQAGPFPGADFTAKLPKHALPTPARLDWVLYLEDSPRRDGSIDLGSELERVRVATERPEWSVP